MYIILYHTPNLDDPGNKIIYPDYTLKKEEMELLITEICNMRFQNSQWLNIILMKIDDTVIKDILSVKKDLHSSFLIFSSKSLLF